MIVAECECCPVLAFEVAALPVAESETRLIAINVMRVPGNPLIKSTLWLDDVKLKAIEAGEGSP